MQKHKTVAQEGEGDLPGFNVLQHPVSSFALIEPRVSAVSHQLTPLYTLLHQESLEGVIAQEAEFLQTQQTCPECESSDCLLQSQFAFLKAYLGFLIIVYSFFKSLISLSLEWPRNYIIKIKIVATI